MKIEATNIEQLIERSGDQRETMLFLDDFIRKFAPNLERKLFTGPSITMIGYGEMPWKNGSGSGVWPLISMAPQKGSTNLYVAADKEGLPLPQFYGKKLGKVSLGKNCIRIRNTASLDLDCLQLLILDALHWLTNQKNNYGRNCAQPQ